MGFFARLTATRRHARRLARPTHRRARLEPLEERTLLSVSAASEHGPDDVWPVGPGVEPSSASVIPDEGIVQGIVPDVQEVAQPVPVSAEAASLAGEAGATELPDYYYQDLDLIIPGEVLVRFRTSEPISDIGAYVESLDWPAWLGPVTAANIKSTLPWAPDHDYPTHVLLSFDGEFDASLTLHAAEQLRGLPFVESAIPNMVVQHDSPLLEPSEPFMRVKISPVNAHEVGPPSFVPGEVIMVFPTAEPIADLGAYVESLQWPEAIGPVASTDVERSVTTTREDGSYGTLAVLHLRTEIPVLDAVAELEALRFVEYPAPNYVLQPDLVPDDPYYDEEPGNPYEQYHHPLMENPAAWDTTLGDPSVVIAVIDNKGVDTDHEDLVANIDLTYAWDFENDDNDPNPDPGEDHGTHVAGIAAAVTNNDTGVAGTAGAATIMPIRIRTLENLISALRHATDHDADIINTSLGITREIAEYQPYIDELDYVYDNGVLHIGSAGNENEFNPARQELHQTLYVAATGSSDTKASYSNYGTGIDISAPGDDILSTYIGDYYGYMSGTSMAAPNVAGAAALIWSEHPTWTRDQVAAQLIGMADNIDGLNPGYEGLLGSGRVNSNAAVNGTLPPPQIEGLTRIGRTKLFVELGNVFAEWSVELGNWELREDGADGVFGTADDVIVPLTLATDYMIGTNSLKFTYPAIPDGRYRFTGASDTYSPSSALMDPFGGRLDGNGDGVGGDDYVYEFLAFTVQVDAGSEKNDGTSDTFEVVRNGAQVDVKVNGAVARSVGIANAAPIITVIGSNDPDRFYVRRLGWDFGGSVVVDAVGDGDSAHLYDSPRDDTFTAYPTTADFEMQDTYLITANNVPSIYAYGGYGGNDTAVLHDDPAGADTFEAWPNYGRLYGDGFYNQANSFAQVLAYSGVGHGSDTALFYDDPAGDDTFKALPTLGKLYGDGFFNQAKSFAQVRAYSGVDHGSDVAQVYDSTGADSFEAYADSATMSYAGGQTVGADDFRWVHAFSQNGGDDTAEFYDSTGTDTFNAWPAEAKLYGDGFFNRAVSFPEVHGYSENGGEDTATLYDSTGSDTFDAYADSATMSYAGGQTVRADDFRWLFAFASDDDGQTDTARLYDTTADLGTSYATWFKGFNDLSKIYDASTFYNRVDDFDEVIASAVGSDDTAKLWDSPGADAFEAYADQATMSYADGTTVRADDFRWVLGYGSDDGQVDTAEFYDTTADLGTSYATRFNAENGYSELYEEPVFYVNAADFDQVSAAAVGDDDTAKLFDSALDDVYWSRPNHSRMEYADGTYVEALDFRYALAYSENGGDDTATLYDETAGSTSYAARFWGYATWSKLYSGTSFYSKTEGFAEVRAALGGDDDLAWVYDDPTRVDHLVVPFPGTAAAKAQLWNDQRAIYIDDFYELTATTSQSFVDDEDIDPAYEDDVILLGDWAEA